MKLKRTFMLLLATIFAVSGIMTANAATIKNDGTYTLILNSDIEGACYDGEYCKAIRFDVAEGEETVSLSELTKGIVPFNGKYQFSHWGINFSDDTPADDELKLSDFTSAGDYYLADGTAVEYTNGLYLYPKFSDKPLVGTGTYYLTLDGFAGTVNGKLQLTLTSSASEYQTVDLTKYTPVREGCTFVGWDLNGKLVTSVDVSAFAETDAVAVTATYTKNTFEGNDRVAILNANGGTINGKASDKYDYLGGADSGTSMSLLPYTPVRVGYQFTGWNTKSDGSGKNYTYLYWRFWDKDSANEFEKDTFIENQNGAVYYQNLTLYATWVKTDTVKEIKSTGETSATIEFADGINKDYKLDIKKIEVKKELANKNVKFIADINVLDGNSVVTISDTKMKIRIALPEDLKGYKKYEVAYILNDEIKETIPATVEDGYIVFETSHLSQYGIIATNTVAGGSEATSPKTGDNSNIALWVAVLFVSCIGVIGGAAYGRSRRFNK